MAGNADIVAAIDRLGERVGRLEKRVAITIMGDMEDPRAKPGLAPRVQYLEDQMSKRPDPNECMNQLSEAVKAMPPPVLCERDRGRLWLVSKFVVGFVVSAFGILATVIGWIFTKLP